MEINAFLYMVYPKTVLKNIPYIGFIFRRGTFKLTKEAVQACMKGATVYRKFSNDFSEKVTSLNIDRLHNAEYISEEDWNNGNIVGTELVDNTENYITDINNSTDEVADEVKSNEAFVTENIVEEVQSSPIADSTEAVNSVKEEAVLNPVEEAQVESSDDEISNDVENESTVVDEPVIEEQTTIIDPLAEIENEDFKPAKVNINYNGNKKKHNK